MFSGLIEAVGTVESLQSRGPQARLKISIPFADELALGDSVAVNGCCLTVAGQTPGSAVSHFDVLAQTLKVTSLGELAEGSTVNLERALRLGDRLGGHFVQGHVDATGTILAIEPHGADHRLVVSLPEIVSPHCIDKGSLAIDGISLTIANLTAAAAEFWITPHTWAHTHLPTLSIGATVNLEADMIAKHIAALVRPHL